MRSLFRHDKLKQSSEEGKIMNGKDNVFASSLSFNQPGTQ